MTNGGDSLRITGFTPASGGWTSVPSSSPASGQGGRSSVQNPGASATGGDAFVSNRGVAPQADTAQRVQQQYQQAQINARDLFKSLPPLELNTLAAQHYPRSSSTSSGESRASLRTNGRGETGERNPFKNLSAAGLDDFVVASNEQDYGQRLSFFNSSEAYVTAN